jgi:hypothetical protein
MSNATIAHQFGQRPRVVLETITPERAKQLWEMRAQNRPVRQPAVARLASDMARKGGWEVNGETIKIGPDGRLIDGQHRIAACILAGFAFVTFVAYDVADYREVDVVIPKTVADSQVMFDGRRPGPRAAKAMEGALRHLLGYTRQANSDLPKLNLSHAVRANILSTNAQLGRCFPSWAAQFVVEGGDPGKSQASTLKPSIALAMLWLCEIAERDADPVIAFLNAVRDGADLSSGDPAMAYRNMIIGAAMRKRSVSLGESFRLALSALICHLADKKIVVVRPSSATFPGASPKQVESSLGIQELLG